MKARKFSENYEKEQWVIQILLELSSDHFTIEMNGDVRYDVFLIL